MQLTKEERACGRGAAGRLRGIQGDGLGTRRRANRGHEGTAGQSKKGLVMYREDAGGLDDLGVATSMRQHTSSQLPVLEVAMALFGMVWLLRVRSEMRRCSKCRREELLVAQQQNTNRRNEQHQQQSQHQQQRPHHQHCTASQTTSLIHTSEDGLTMSSANTLFTLDTPGASGPAGSYCEVHGYVAPKEGIISSLSFFNLSKVRLPRYQN